jgi:hypothetical protein
MEIEWRDPPPQEVKRGRNGGAVKTFIEELKKHPGKWAVYRSVPKKDVKRLNGSRHYLKYKYECEVTVRIEKQKVTLFVRWPEEKHTTGYKADPNWKKYYPRKSQK